MHFLCYAVGMAALAPFSLPTVVRCSFRVSAVWSTRALAVPALLWVAIRHGVVFIKPIADTLYDCRVLHRRIYTRIDEHQIGDFVRIFLLAAAV